MLKSCFSNVLSLKATNLPLGFQVINFSYSSASACGNRLMHNVFAFKVTFLYKDFLAREAPRTYLCRSIIMSYSVAVTAAIVSIKKK